MNKDGEAAGCRRRPAGHDGDQWTRADQTSRPVLETASGIPTNEQKPEASIRNGSPQTTKKELRPGKKPVTTPAATVEKNPDFVPRGKPS